jgi:hypothetical protein
VKEEAFLIDEIENILQLRLPGYHAINNLLPGIFLKKLHVFCEKGSISHSRPYPWACS